MIDSEFFWNWLFALVVCGVMWVAMVLIGAAAHEHSAEGWLI